MKSIKLSELVRTKVNSLDPSKFSDKQFNLCSISAFDQGKPEVLFGKEIGSSKKILIKGDVVISRIVPHIKRVWEIPIENENIVIGSGEWIVFNSPKVFDGYLRHFLQTELFHKQFMGTVRGVGGSLLRADPKLTGKIEMPLPPLSTQKKIAAILDAADLYRQKTKTLIEKYDLLAQSLFLEMFGDPFEGKCEQLKDSIRVIGGYAFKSTDFIKNGIPVIKIGTVNKGYFDLKSLSFMSINDIDRYLKWKIYPNDLLISLTGTVGKDDYANIEIATDEYEFYLLNQRVAKIEIKNFFDRLFLYYLFKQPDVKRKLTDKSRGVRQANISNDDILELKLIRPELNLQNQFAERIQLINQQKQQAQASLQKAEDLFNSLLQRAFKGELVAE